MGQSAASFAKGFVDELYVEEISDTNNPLRFNDDQISELALSIEKVGLLQPIIVRSKNDDYEVVAGNRRLAACKLLRWRKIQCHIVELDDKTAFEVSLIENIHRKSMDPVEEAEAFRKYASEYGWGSAMQLANKLGKSASYISRRLSLLNLPADVVDRIRAGDITPSVAEELARIKNLGNQSRVLSLLLSIAQPQCLVALS